VFASNPILWFMFYNIADQLIIFFFFFFSFFFFFFGKGEFWMIFSLSLRGTVEKRKNSWTSMLESVTPILIRLSLASLLTVKMMAPTCTY
jgi:hypothetical protein